MRVSGPIWAFACMPGAIERDRAVKLRAAVELQGTTEPNVSFG